MIPSPMVSFTFSMIKFCMNTVTRTQYMSANATLPPQDEFLSSQHQYVYKTIPNSILQEDTRGLFREWNNHDYDWAVTPSSWGLSSGSFSVSAHLVLSDHEKLGILEDHASVSSKSGRTSEGKKTKVKRKENRLVLDFAKTVRLPELLAIILL